MRVQSIELEGFRSWRTRQCIDLSGMSLVGIVGANRAGKTSLLTAIEFALWGSTRGASVNDVINSHAKAARVTLQFETLGQTYRIERTRTRAGRHEVLFCTADPTAPTGWRELAEKHPSVADPVIVATIGMDEQTSALTWLVRQNEYGAFCTLTPTARRQALVAAFGLDRYMVLAERADELRRTAERDLDQHRWSVEHLTAQLDAARHEVEQAGDPHALQAEADRLAGELDQVAAQLAGPAETARRARADLERLHTDHATAREEAERKRVWLRRQAGALSSRLEAARQRIRQAEHAADQIPTIAADLDAQRDMVGRIGDRLAALAEEQSALVEQMAAAEQQLLAQKARMADLQRRADALAHTDGGICIVCDSTLPPDRAHQLAEKTAAQIRHAEEAITDLTTAIAAHRGDRAGLSERIGQGRHRLEEARHQVEQLTYQLARARHSAILTADDLQAVTDLEAQIADNDAELATITDPILDTDLAARLEAATRQIDLLGLRERQSRLRAASADATTRLAAREHAKAAITKGEQDLLVARAALDIAQTRLDDLVVVRDEFRPAGIPSNILAGALEELNSEANALMEATGTDGLQIQVSTQRTTQKGTPTEAITIYTLTADGQQMDYTTLSGSEQFRVALAIRTGLSRCIARRTGIPVHLMQIDEGWGNLDEPTRAKVAAVLTRLATELQIITVSHIDDVKAGFEHLVQVSDATGTSVGVVV